MELLSWIEPVLVYSILYAWEFLEQNFLIFLMLGGGNITDI